MPSKMRVLVVAAIATVAWVGLAPSQEQAQLPEGKLYAALPQILRSAELRFSEDGRGLLAVRHYSSKREPVISVYDTKARPAGYTTLGQRFYPLVGSDLFGKVDLGKDSYGKVLAEFRRIGLAAEISSDSKQFLTYSLHTIRVWDFATGKPIGPTLEHVGNVKAAFQADGKQLLTARILTGKGSGAKSSYEVALLETESGKSLGSFSTLATGIIGGSDNHVKSLLWAPDQKSFLLTYSSSTKEADSVRLFDAGTVQPVGDPLPARGEFYQFTSDGKDLVAVSRKETVVWSIGERKPLHKVAMVDIWKDWDEGAIEGVSIDRQSWFATTPGGTSILYMNSAQSQLWDLSAVPPQRKCVLEHPEGAYSISMSRDGKLAATASGDSEKMQVVLWDLESGRRLFRIPLAPSTFTDMSEIDSKLMAMAFSPDGKILAVVDGMGVRLWNTNPKK